MTQIVIQEKPKRGRPRKYPPKAPKVPKPTHKLAYYPRPWQTIAHNRPERYRVLVDHRRAGKTEFACAEMLDRAFKNTREGALYWYLAPQRNQAKTVVWERFKRIMGDTINLPGVKINESELSIRLPHGPTVQLWGCDKPDMLRGPGLDGVIMDEVAQMPSVIWGQIIRPMLMDTKGWAIFIGTPKGRNLFYRLHLAASQDTTGEWWTRIFTAQERQQILDVWPGHEREAAAYLSEVSSFRAELEALGEPPETFDQELGCSFLAAIKGAYWGREIEAARSTGRITTVPVDPALQVHTAWDLGMSDYTSIWLFQLAPGGQVRILSFYQSCGQGLQHYVSWLSAFRDRHKIIFGTHLAPHDIQVRELSTGVSRIDTARSLGINFTMVPRHGLPDGINAVRQILPMCWFDMAACEDGIESLGLYRAQEDPRFGILKDAPVHDENSHPADAFRYLAMGKSLIRDSYSGIAKAEHDRLSRLNQYPR